MCHADVDAGFRSTKHATAAKHACRTCHGRSAEHSWSEDGHVKPDKALADRPSADALCHGCHKDAKHRPALEVERRRCSLCHKPHPKSKKNGPPAKRAADVGADPGELLAATAADLDKQFGDAIAGLKDDYAVPANFLAFKLRRAAAALGQHDWGQRRAEAAALIATLARAADQIRAELKQRRKAGTLAKAPWLQKWHAAVRTRLRPLLPHKPSHR